MSRRYHRRRNVISCGNCGANYDARGEDPRCPACNASTREYEPGEARPVIRGFEDVEAPDLLWAVHAPEPDETAPPEDFVAAGLVVLAVVFIVAGVFTRSPVTFNLGIAIFALTALGFAAWKIFQLATGRRKRRENPYEAPSMFEWLMGRGFWDRFR